MDIVISREHENIAAIFLVIGLHLSQVMFDVELKKR